MKRIIYICIPIILASCRPYGKDFFTCRSTCHIKEDYVPTNYKKVQEDYMLPNSAIIEEPLIDLNVKYDIEKKYSVILYCDIIFHETEDGFWDSSRNDSIKLRRLIITGKDIDNTIYDKSNPIDFKTCIIPSEILYSIREDFFLRMKYTKFNFGKIKHRGYTYGHPYLLF